jgi:hypothetical protein
MNLFLLGFIIQLVILYGMILFSDYLDATASQKATDLRRPVKVRIRKP